MAAPAAAANRCGTGVGQPASTETVISARPTANSEIDHGSTLRCPFRSTSRACSTANSAPAIRYDAEIDPASVYDPVRVDTRITMPRLTIDSGSLARRPLSENAAAPGRPSTRP